MQCIAEGSKNSQNPTVTEEVFFKYFFYVLILKEKHFPKFSLQCNAEGSKNEDNNLRYVAKTYFPGHIVLGVSTIFDTSDISVQFDQTSDWTSVDGNPYHAMYAGKGIYFCTYYSKIPFLLRKESYD